jgi:hypothetical protein
MLCVASGMLSYSVADQQERTVNVGFQAENMSFAT